MYKEKLIEYKYQLFSKYTSQYSSEEFQKDLAVIEEFLYLYQMMIVWLMAY